MIEGGHMMMRGRLILLGMVGGLLSMAAPSESAAQLELGVHGSINDIGRTATGVGGRVGAVVRNGLDLQLVLEGSVDTYFPDCTLADCSVVGAQVHLLVQRRFGSIYQGYLGFGAVFQDFTLEDDGQTLVGDDYGITLLVGNRFRPGGAVEPFVEVRFSIMDELQNQAGFAAGLRIPIGGERAGN